MASGGGGEIMALNDIDTSTWGTAKSMLENIPKILANFNIIKALVGANGAVTVAQGGTGATDAATARANLGAAGINSAATITYNANGTVKAIAVDGKTYTIAYNANGTVNTISDGTTTRTCAYTNGNLTSVA